MHPQVGLIASVYPVIREILVCVRESGPTVGGRPMDEKETKSATKSVGRNSKSCRTAAPKAWPITNIMKNPTIKSTSEQEHCERHGGAATESRHRITTTSRIGGQPS